MFTLHHRDFLHFIWKAYLLVCIIVCLIVRLDCVFIHPLEEERKAFLIVCFPSVSTPTAP